MRKIYMKKSFAFTLGEILIAVGVIGVIASLTIPQMLGGKKATEASAKFNTAYSILAKSIDDMENAGVSIRPESYTETNSFYKVFKQFHKVAVSCGTFYNTETKNDAVCISKRENDDDSSRDKYSTADGEKQMNIGILDDGAFVLQNGMLIMLENSTAAKGNVLITVDINGKNKRPNRWGHDVFTFQLTNRGLFPYGAPETTETILDDVKARDNTAGTEKDTFCNLKENNIGELNGITCAFRALSDADYFKRIYKEK